MLKIKVKMKLKLFTAGNLAAFMSATRRTLEQSL